MLSAHTVHEMPCILRRRYEVTLRGELLHPERSPLPALLEGRQALVVTTPTVSGLYGAHLRALAETRGLRLRTLVLPCTEPTKTLRSVERVCREAAELGLERDAVLVSMSGGVSSDVVTLAAALIRRGIAHVRVPTTLIGQVDAGVGVKGAVNFRGKKSFLGCYHPPAAVLIDPAFLRTVPVSHLRYGLAEILKMGIVRDAELFDLVAAHWRGLLQSRFQGPERVVHRVLYLSAKRMLDELEPNLYEDQTYRRLVDAGHTFSPPLEAASGFSLHHGEAVAVDLALSATLASVMGRLARDQRDRIVETIGAVGLPIHHAALDLDLCTAALADAERHRAGAVNLVVPVEIGRGAFLERRSDIDGAALRESLRLLARDQARLLRRWPPVAEAPAVERVS